MPGCCNIYIVILFNMYNKKITRKLSVIVDFMSDYT